MVPELLIENAGRRLITIVRSARLITAAQAFDRPENRLIIVVDEEGAMVGVVSRTDIVARISHCTGCSCTETDHIAPWKSVYKTKLFTDCELTFVLTKGGHNGGILSEPGHAGRYFRISHRPAGGHCVGPDGWLAENTPKPGSWWPDWSQWLADSSSGTTVVPAMGAPGKGYAPMAAAPGTYIHQT